MPAKGSPANGETHQIPQGIQNKKDAHCTVFVPGRIRVGRFPTRKSLQTNGILGAGRGNRTPMELLPTDFEPDVSSPYRRVLTYTVLFKGIQWCSNGSCVTACQAMWRYTRRYDANSPCVSP